MKAPIVLTLNLLEDSILLNEGILEALDWPQQVQIMINNAERMLLLRSCSVEDQQAVVIPSENTMQCEISGRSLLRKLRKLAGWNDDRPRMCYGEYLPTHQAIRFDLMTAQAVDINGRSGDKWIGIGS